jgi:uncharacterized protein YheU (UPF0270 family)
VSHIKSNIDHTASAIREGSGPTPGTLVQMLAEDEKRLQSATAEHSVLESKLAELENFDPASQQETLDRLLEAISTKEGEDSSAVRRALAAEIKRSLTKIVITPVRRVAWEILEEKPYWLARFGGLNASELQDAFDQLNFEFVFVYRNGRDQFIDPLSEEYYELNRSMRFDVMRAMHRAKSM